MWEKPEHADSALIAQLAEHALSKRKVTSSNLVGGFPVRVGVVGNISACHADAPGSIPGRGAVFAVFHARFLPRPFFIPPPSNIFFPNMGWVEFYF